MAENTVAWRIIVDEKTERSASFDLLFLWLRKSPERRLLDAHMNGFTVGAPIRDIEVLSTFSWVADVVPEEDFHRPCLVAAEK